MTIQSVANTNFENKIEMGVLNRAWKLLSNVLFFSVFMLLIMGSMPAWSIWGDQNTGIHIATTINGQESSSKPGLEVRIDESVALDYTITNTGKNKLKRVNVYDLILDRNKWFGRLHRVCRLSGLESEETKTCSRETTAKPGQHTVLSFAVAQGWRWWQLAQHRNTSYFYGVDGVASIEVNSLVNGQDADEAPGPQISAGGSVNTVFKVANNGELELQGIVVTEAQVLPEAGEEESVCEIEALAPGETETCSRSITAEIGQHQSLVKVAATTTGGKLVTDTDSNHYSGVPGGSLSARPVATPSSGLAPLQVTFSPNAVTDNAIVRYEWDLDGDGSYDRSETVGRNQTTTYNNPGQVNVSLRVTDNKGAQAVGVVTVVVGNQAPEVSVELSPSNGEIPLLVNFSATASDADGVERYEWDFNGDGAYEETTSNGETSHSYEQAGAFTARLRVTDSLGASTIISAPTLEVKALPKGSPTVTLQATPNEGDAPLNVTFVAVASDPDGGDIDQYEWDFDGDGNYDETTSTNTSSTIFDSPGVFYSRVRVRDTSGQKSEDVEKIYVRSDITMGVNGDTIDPHVGEKATVETILGGNTEVSIVIENKNGELVRTLLPFTTRAAGEYEDTWDGTDASGNTVLEGEYRAILISRINGSEKRLDLALDTGGRESNPSRSSLPNTFYPFAGDPLMVDFTLQQPSEVTAFMGLQDINARLVTFMQRRPLGRGTHQIIWNGENADGQLIEAPPGDNFLFGIFAYTLPDNSIYVRSGVHSSLVTASPPVYVPTQYDPDGDANLSAIQVTLSRSGSARLVINDVKTGSTVASFVYKNLKAGVNTLTWDGRDNNGQFVAPGSYRLGVSGLDASGYESMAVFALQRIYY